MLVTFKNNSESYLKVFADLCILFTRFGLLIWLYHYLYMYLGATIKGESYQTIVWSMFFYFTFLTINPRYIARGIQADIQSGNIEILLSKPINYILYKFSYYLGSRLFFFLINTLLGTIAMVYIVGVPEIIYTWTFVLTFPVTLLLCFVLTFLIYILLGLLSFWIEDIAPLQWIIDKASMILGGSYLPIAFFPPIMKSLATWSPFGASQFVSHVAYSSWLTDYWKLMLLQVAWVVLFSVATYFLFQKAVKNTSVNGG